MIGQLVGQYRVVSPLGGGSMGEVYRAVDEMLDRDVALKILRPELAHDRDIVERFRREAVTLARLDHPNIARLHGLIKHDTSLVMVMEFVNGETLAARLKRGRVAWRASVDLVGQLLRALEYAHAQGIVHRDIKPSNVMVRPDGCVKVTDFGIARVLGTARVTRVGHMIGTLEYMSPEQVRGEDVTASSDLYSTGVVLYELLSGRMPFEGRTDAELIRQHLRGAVPPLGAVALGLPVWFDQVVVRALEKTPDARFESASRFRGELDRLTATEPEPALKPTRLGSVAAGDGSPQTRLADVSAVPAAIVAAPAAAIPRTKSRSRWTWRHGAAAAAIVAALAAVPAVIGLLRTSQPTPQPTNAPTIVPQATVAPAVVPPPPEPPPPVAAPAKVPEPVKTPVRRVEAPVADAPSKSASAVEPHKFPVRKFEDVKIVTDGREGGHEEPVILNLEETRIALMDPDSEKVLRAFSYDSITGGSYSETQRRVVFVKTTQHWLTLRTAQGRVVLRLDKNNYFDILPLIEERTGLKLTQ